MRVHGTGRLTVRNRLFLRKYSLRSHTVEGERDLFKISSKDFITPKNRRDVVRHTVDHLPKKSANEDIPTQQYSADVPGQNMQQVSDEQNIEQNSQTQSVAPELPARPVTSVTEPNPTPSSLPLEDTSPCLGRSTRVKVPRKLYNPSTGTYVSN